ncbi:MAG TPA: HEPN domain-containing protein [Candidatus Prevotella stercoripullorum]|nr:HEPN domain-containing protein [Candidatus Prevotella stercoripullorum]
MLTAEERKAIIRFRIEKAHKSFNEAKAVAGLGFWNLAGNRLYYAVYYMASALLLDKGISAKTHAGTIHLLGQKIINTGMLDASFGRLFSRLYELRQAGDYDDMFDATEQEVKPYIDKVSAFLTEVEKHITFK